VKNLCQKLGVNDEVNSPTFALVNEYQTETFDSIFHFDFYRIKSLEEVFDIGYEDYFYGGSLCLLEWPELIDPLMPEHFIKVEITHGDTDTSRKIRCSLV
jgi:tRNA threonylcarbamoyladenosine biosynthesis protein TsaE